MVAAFVSGQTLTAGALNTAINRHEPIEAEKFIDQTVTNSTTYVDDDELFVTLEANETYDWEWSGICIGLAAADLKSRWTFPTGAETSLFNGGPATTLGAGNDQGDGLWGARVYDGTSPTTEVLIGQTDTTNPTIAHQWGRIRMGSTAGALRLQWAQQVANATGSTIKAGSKLTARKVDI